MLNPNPILLCSDCFKDEGLSMAAFKAGIKSNLNCPNCNSRDGRKLNASTIESLSYGFFVRGTLHRSYFGAAPIIQANKKVKSEIDFDDSLLHDTELIHLTTEIGFFYYGPRLWMVGGIEPLLELQSNETKFEIIREIIESFPSKTITEKETFYRLRKNPEQPVDIDQYDSPPESGSGRLDSNHLSILYGSQDIEVCIHECRSTVEDELYMASLTPTKSIKLLDLTKILIEGGDEFESLDLTIQMLFYSNNHSYQISRDLASKISEAGFDGIIYPSYFSTIRTGAMPFDSVYGISIRKLPLYTDYANAQVIPNIALFGRPIQEGIVTVKCINRIMLSKVKYELQFGPAKY